MRLPRKKRIIVYGHSLGSIVAFEFLHRVKSIYETDATLLVVSGRNQPKDLVNDIDCIFSLSDIDFLDKISLDYGGIDDKIINNKDLRSVIIPVLRADMAMSYKYSMKEYDKLQCPIAAFSGDIDHGASLNSMSEWKKFTNGDFFQKSFSGGHFFIVNQTKEVISQIISISSLQQNNHIIRNSS